MSDVSDIKAELLVLKAENAKLRELVRDMVDWAYISDYCDLEEQFGDRMRELGVDV